MIKKGEKSHKLSPLPDMAKVVFSKNVKKTKVISLIRVHTQVYYEARSLGQCSKLSLTCVMKLALLVGSFKLKAALTAQHVK